MSFLQELCGKNFFLLSLPQTLQRLIRRFHEGFTFTHSHKYWVISLIEIIDVFHRQKLNKRSLQDLLCDLALFLFENSRYLNGTCSQVRHNLGYKLPELKKKTKLILLISNIAEVVRAKRQPCYPTSLNELGTAITSLFF